MDYAIFDIALARYAVTRRDVGYKILKIDRDAGSDGLRRQVGYADNQEDIREFVLFLLL
jgi:hypothetical protein